MMYYKKLIQIPDAPNSKELQTKLRNKKQASDHLHGYANMSFDSDEIELELETPEG